MIGGRDTVLHIDPAVDKANLRTALLDAIKRVWHGAYVHEVCAAPCELLVYRDAEAAAQVAIDNRMIHLIITDTVTAVTGESDDEYDSIDAEIHDIFAGIRRAVVTPPALAPYAITFFVRADSVDDAKQQAQGYLGHAAQQTTGATRAAYTDWWFAGHAQATAIATAPAAAVAPRLPTIGCQTCGKRILEGDGQLRFCSVECYNAADGRTQP